MGKTKVCPRPEGTLNFDSPIFCEVKTVFRLRIVWKLAKGHRIFGNSLPLNFFFENFQNDHREFLNSSFDEKFHTEKHYNGAFFDKEIWFCIFHDFVTSYMNKMLYDVLSPHILTLYKKISRCNVFQYENPDRMRYLRTLYDHFENFRKIKFQWERIFEKPLAF